MQVAVLGAGVAGVTSAYYLARSGCTVTLVDQAGEAGAGASHANGGQLSFSFTDALARPSFLATLPSLLLGRDPASRVRLAARPLLLGWGFKFLAQCTNRRAIANTVAVLELAMRSAGALRALREHTGIAFSHAAGGKLVLLPEGADLDAARRTRDLKLAHGCGTELLTIEEARAIEPAIAAMRGDYAAAVYAADDEVGDAREFAVGLANWLSRRGDVDLRLRTRVTGLLTARGRVRGVSTDAGELAADAVVVCLGAASPFLTRGLGIRLPVYPVRGYSLTLPPGRSAPAVSITDLARRVLYCPLGGALRVSGFADFLGFDSSADDRRLDMLFATARAAAPAAADYTVADQARWAGNRPLTPDGRPLTGGTRVPGLYLNCGHGMLGWTLATATAMDVATAVTGRSAGDYSGALPGRIVERQVAGCAGSAGRR